MPTRTVEVAPSRVFNYYRKTVTTNRWGMRDREFDLAKPPGTFRIGLFGESHTFGNGVADEEVYEQLVEMAVGCLVSPCKSALRARLLPDERVTDDECPAAILRQAQLAVRTAINFHAGIS